ncbi:MAG: aminopeptidase [Bacilli bacterium]|nr:aminopeptidase [Bacilli bacterium]
MKKSVLKKYAKLIVRVGGNVQKGQDVELLIGVEQELLATYIVEECYKVGARKVNVRWQSDKTAKVAYKKATVKALSTMENYEIERQRYLSEKLPVMIYIESSDPDAMKGVNQAKIAKVSQNVYPIIKPFRKMRENKYQWIIAGAASPEWAKKVFPDLPKKKAVEALWDAIIKTSRCDNDDPIKAWKEHNDDLKKRTTKLNSLNLDYLHYTSKNGTDFKVWLLPNVNWLAGGEEALGSNIFYNPNIPSEEAFTSPCKGKAEGIVYSTKPLSYMGELIEDFSVRFENGKAVEVKAKKGEELLKQMIKMDENACYLGECALVPFDSPINNTGILFFNTLYDENAACHLALGRGFTNLVKDYHKYTEEELIKMGINDSQIHVDFMIGSKDLSIVGYTRDGKKVQIFKDGNWAF